MPASVAGPPQAPKNCAVAHDAQADSRAWASDGVAHPARQLNLFDATSMVVGIILGSGIFVAPAAVAALSVHVSYGIALWIAGALVALCGALTYAECGARLPEDGGFFIFYERAFGWPWAFVAGWAALAISYPTSLAGVTALGTQYLDAAVPALAQHPQAVAVATLSTTAVLNALGVPLGQLAQRLLTWAKVLAVLLVLAAALWWGTWHPPSAQALPRTHAWPSARQVLAALATLMWTYDGWTDITMVAGEIERPRRNLARAVIFGLVILCGVYAAVQVAVMVLLGAERAAASPQVLAAALAEPFGPHAQATLAWLVLLTTLGSVHGLMFATSRLAFAMAERGALPRMLAHLSPRFGVPVRSIALVWAVSCGYVLAKDFAGLLEIFALVIWLFYGATALALWRLRRQGVGAPRGEAMGGLGLDSQIAPGVLLLAAIGMTALQVCDNPGRAAFVLGSLLVGRGLVYVLGRKLHVAGA